MRRVCETRHARRVASSSWSTLSSQPHVAAAHLAMLRATLPETPRCGRPDIAAYAPQLSAEIHQGDRYYPQTTDALLGGSGTVAECQKPTLIVC